MHAVRRWSNRSCICARVSVDAARKAFALVPPCQLRCTTVAPLHAADTLHAWREALHIGCLNCCDEECNQGPLLGNGMQAGTHSGTSVSHASQLTRFCRQPAASSAKPASYTAMHRTHGCGAAVSAALLAVVCALGGAQRAAADASPPRGALNEIILVSTPTQLKASLDRGDSNIQIIEHLDLTRLKARPDSFNHELFWPRPSTHSIQVCVRHNQGVPLTE